MSVSHRLKNTAVIPRVRKIRHGKKYIRSIASRTLHLHGQPLREAVHDFASLQVEIGDLEVNQDLVGQDGTFHAAEENDASALPKPSKNSDRFTASLR